MRGLPSEADLRGGRPRLSLQELDVARILLLGYAPHAGIIGPAHFRTNHAGTRRTTSALPDPISISHSAAVTIAPFRMAVDHAR